MSDLELCIYIASVFLQVAALVFCVLMVRQRRMWAPWAIMSGALLMMLGFRILRLISTGANAPLTIPEDVMQTLTAVVSAGTSLLLFLSLFAIRKLSAAQQQATIALEKSTERSERSLAKMQAVVESMSEGLIITDGSGEVLTMNNAARAIHGLDATEKPPSNLKEFPAAFDITDTSGNTVPIGDWPVTRAMRGQPSSGIEFAVNNKSKQGPKVIVSAAASAIRRADGTIYLAVLTLRDVTEDHRSQKELSDSRRRLQSLFDTAQDAIFLCDDQARYVDANPAACELTGYSCEELVKTNLWALTPTPEHGTSDATWRSFLEAGRLSGEYELIRKDGRRVAAEYRAVANILPGLHLSVVRDITERKQFERALRENSEHLSLALGAAKLGDWHWNPDTDLIFLSQRAAELYGVPMVPPQTRNAMRSLLHDDDRERARAASQRASAEGTEYDVEYRVNRADATQIWIAAKGRGRYDVNGKMVAMLGVVQDVTARKMAEQEREQMLAGEREARATAELNSRMKDEFLATLSHELRTPLTAILGWAHVLLAGAAGAPESDDLKQGLQTIERNARAQTRIIEDLLDMSRIISGKIRLDVQRIDVLPVVESAVDTVRPAANARNVHLDIRATATHDIYGDASRLQQVFWNLLSNAVKFSRTGGHVRVAIERQGGQVLIAVTDDGEGIASDFLPYVFDRFRQADGSTTRRHGGLGLGLSIVRHLVELHGGSASVWSAGQGRGATFTVALPALGAAVIDHPTASHPFGAADGAGNHASSDGVSLAGIRVLVVDDEIDARAMLTRLLSDRGAIVAAAGTVIEALEAMQTHRPDLLISDIGMPEQGGYALIEKVRQMPLSQGGATPAIALTAYARDEDRKQVLQAGFQRHIAKPVEPSALFAAVQAMAADLSRGPLTRQPMPGNTATQRDQTAPAVVES